MGGLSGEKSKEIIRRKYSHSIGTLRSTLSPSFLWECNREQEHK